MDAEIKEIIFEIAINFIESCDSEEKVQALKASVWRKVNSIGLDNMTAQALWDLGKMAAKEIA